MRTYTLLIEANNDIPFPPEVIVNGEKVNCYGLAAEDKSEHYNDMEELLDTMHNSGELPIEYEDKIEKLLIASGYWGEEDD